MNRTIPVVEVEKSLEDLVNDRDVRSRVLYFEGDWWYEASPIKELVTRKFGPLPQKVAMEIERVPSDEIQSKVIQGCGCPPMCTAEELLYAAISLKLEGIDLLKEGERILGWGEPGGRLFVIWRLSGRYLINAFLMQAKVNGAYAIGKRL